MPTQERLDLTHAQLLVVDIQQKLIPYVRDHADVIAQSVRMIRAAREVDIPITLTEEYRKGLGPTDPAVLEACGDAPCLEKTAFSACADEAARERIVSLMRPSVVVVGIETHVCVQQTALDLLATQMQPLIAVDAVGSRRQLDHEVGLSRMQSAGAVITTVESVIFHLLGKSGTDLFRRVLPLVH